MELIIPNVSTYNCLYESPYQKVSYFKEYNLLIAELKDTTGTINDDQFLVETHTLFKFYRKYKPLKVLCSISGFEAKLNPESPQFIANLFKETASKYTALVSEKPLPQQFENIVALMKLTVQEKIVRIFNNSQEGLEWLLNS